MHEEYEILLEEASLKQIAIEVIHRISEIPRRIVDKILWRLFRRRVIRLLPLNLITEKEIGRLRESLKLRLKEEASKKLGISESEITVRDLEVRDIISEDIGSD